MAAPTRTPRTSWIYEGLRALAVGGPDAVRVEKLAQALGVTKGGFYWHFADRPALIGEMLDVWEQAMVADVITRVDSSATDPRARLRQLFALAPTANGATPLARARVDHLQALFFSIAKRAAHRWITYRFRGEKAKVAGV